MPLTMLTSTTGQHDWPDLQLAAAPFAMRSSKEMKAESGRGPLSSKPGITFAGFDLRPFSRGSVHITSTDPRASPTVNPGWWTDERDKAKHDIQELTKKYEGIAADMAKKREDEVMGE